MANAKPPRAGMGRPKGAVNKASKELKEMILGALDESGGIAYLVKRANDPRTASAFLGLIGKVLPMQVTGADGKDLIPGSIGVVFISGEPASKG